MSFFSITITQYELHKMQFEVSWPDLPSIRRKSGWVYNNDDFIVTILSIQSQAIKDIVVRYTNQRYKALENTSFKSSAETLHNSLTAFKNAQSLGNVCKWVRENVSKLEFILPSPASSHGHWREVIRQIIDFCEAYHDGDGRETAIQHLKKIKYATTEVHK